MLHPIPRLGAAVALALLVAGCVTTSGGAPSGAGATPARLATNASLSVEAIRLQSTSEKLMSLAEEQEAARDRSRKYALQGAGIGAVVGGAGSAAAGCLGQQVMRGDGCSTEQALLYAVPGIIAGGLAGNEMGKKVAGTQNDAAASENAVKRRMQVASQQLTAARQARAQADKVAAQNIAKLRQMKAAVAAGKASQQQLDLARADAAADANQIRAAAAATGEGARSLASNASDAKAQTQAETKNLQNAQASMTSEPAKITAQHKALVQAINQSAL